MKKVTLKWKRHSHRVSVRRLRRLRKKRQQAFSRRVPRVWKKIVAPIDFSMIGNPEAFLYFCREFEELVKNKFIIRVDLQGVRHITLDAIIYLLSIFDYFEAKNIPMVIEGNEPSDEECRQIFQNSGFYKYIKRSTGIAGERNDKIFAIESGEQRVNEVAKNVAVFTRKSLKIKEQKSTEGVYSTIIECMENTKQHAYKENSFLPRWWLAAYLNPATKIITYAFLDNGLGIPTTVKLNFREKFNKIFMGRPVNDSDLISSALNGEFRTKTKLQNRGKGLPQIFQFAKNKQIRDLVIVSNQGYFSLKNSSQTRQLTKSFRGTLFSWSYDQNRL